MRIMLFAVVTLIACAQQPSTFTYRSEKYNSAGNRGTEWLCSDQQFKQIVTLKEFPHTYCRDAKGNLVRDGVTLQKFVVQGILLAGGSAVEVEGTDRLDVVASLGMTVWTKKEWGDFEVRMKTSKFGRKDWPTVSLDEAYVAAQDLAIQKRATELGCDVVYGKLGEVIPGARTIKYVDKNGKDCGQ